MSSEEEQEVFEITDFTTASDWERFIARIEEIIHEWKLPFHKPQSVLKKGDLTDGTWLEEREKLLFASFQFEAVYYHLKVNSPLEGNKKNPDDQEEEEDEGEAIPYCLTDMMSRENDFPPRAHCLVRWYGIRDFVVIHPAKASDAIMTEDRTKMLLSSVFIAINNTNCQVPIFIQLQQMRQKFFLGACEGGGVRTHFEMVHLHRPFSQFNHLTGLLSLFKSKLSSSVLDIPPVLVTVRFTYVLQDWSPCSWPQPPPDIDELGDDITPTDIAKLPCGAFEDSILEFQLSALWPALSDDVVIDNDVHTDLDPIYAPKWTFRMRASENLNGSMGEYLRKFYLLAQGYESVNQLLLNALDDEMDDENITEVLDRLAQPAAIPSLSSILPQTRSRHPNSSDNSLITEEVMIKILQFIFPDSAPTPEEQDSDEYIDTFGSVSDLGNITGFTKVQEHLRSVKSAPVGSLTWRLALAMCHVNHSYGGLPAVSQLWQDLVLEMRHRWEKNYTLPCLEPGPPNMTYCILHQKLQMLNCCIQRKKAREWQNVRRSKTSIDEEVRPSARKSIDEETRLSSSSGGPAAVSESEDEEFFECQDISSTAQDTTKRKQVPEGRLRQLGNLTLLHSQDPLYIPITQEPAPITEDLLEQQAEVLVQLGAHPEGAALRARMQSACLMSDMEAFKAANPKAELQDFVRWYSPRDLVEEEVVDEITKKKVLQHRLSARMLLPGNMWLEAWESARPVPAKRQKRLFDDTKEAEKVLHFLTSARTSDAVTYLMPMLSHCAILHLSEEEHSPVCLVTKLEEAAVKASKVTRSSTPKYEGVLRCLHDAEIIVAQLQSIRTKFYDKPDERKNSPSSGPRSPTSQGEVDKHKAEGHQMTRFITDLLDHSEVEVPDAGKGIIGKRIRHLFSEAQRASHLILDEKPLASKDAPGQSQSHHASVPEFPAASAKEFILRAHVARPASHCIATPQRMFCVLTEEEFRLAGAFSSDTTFM